MFILAAIANATSPLMYVPKRVDMLRIILRSSKDRFTDAIRIKTATLFPWSHMPRFVRDVHEL